MKQEQNPVVLQVVRYGLPLVVAVFYCTAALRFSYTPDSTYLPLQWLRGGEGMSLPLHAGDGQNPLWMLLLKAGGLFRLDPLLTAKVLSLLFCCFALLALYLVAAEVTRDRLLALCCALVAALDPLLLQAGPSGGSLGLGLSLSLAALFFLLRGEDVPAAFFAGLCSLVFWQAFLLFLLILVDIGINGPGKSRWLVGAASIAYGVVVGPWVLVALANGRSLVPMLVPFGDFLAVSWLRLMLFLLCAGLVVAGFFLKRESGTPEEFPGRSAVILWSWVLWMAVCGVMWGPDFWFLGALLVVAGAFDGLRRILSARPGMEAAYAFAFLLTGVLLLVNQFTFLSSVRPVMVRAADQAQDLEYVAFWAKAHVPQEARIQSEKTGLAGYITERRVDPLPDNGGPDAEFVISTRSTLPGYVEVYRPKLAALDSLAGGAVVALFQRQ